MKKQLLAAALATAIAAPMSASAGDVTLYGVIDMSIDVQDVGTGANRNAGTQKDAVAASFDGTDINSNWSRFGIRGTEDLGNGLSAFFQMEFLLDDGEGGGDLTNNRNTFVGLGGSWGKVGMGHVDTPYKSSTQKLDFFNGNWGDNQELGFHDVRAESALFYLSPNWNGFSFAAAVVLPGNQLDAGTATNTDGVEATSLAATYSNGPYYASLAFEELSEEYMETGTEDHEKWRLGLGYTANGFGVGFVYEDRDTHTGADDTSWQLHGSYTMGNNTIKVGYGENDVDNTSDDPSQWSVGLDHKLSSRTKLYAVYTDYDDDAAGDVNDFDAFAVGLQHKF